MGGGGHEPNLLSSMCNVIIVALFLETHFVTQTHQTWLQRVKKRKYKYVILQLRINNIGQRTVPHLFTSCKFCKYNVQAEKCRKSYIYSLNYNFIYLGIYHPHQETEHYQPLGRPRTPYAHGIFLPLVRSYLIPLNQVLWFRCRSLTLPSYILLGVW